MALQNNLKIKITSQNKTITRQDQSKDDHKARRHLITLNPKPDPKPNPNHNPNTNRNGNRNPNPKPKPKPNRNHHDTA